MVLDKSADARLLPQDAEPPVAGARKLGAFGLAVYNLFYWPYLLSSCVLLFAVALVIRGLTVWDRRRVWLGRFTRVWGAHYLSCAPLAGVQVEGAEHLKGLGPCVFVANHQSMVDILALFAVPTPFLWVSKIENFFVPFLGWNMWLNRYVPLRRGHLPSIMKMVRACLGRMAEGHSLCVFPEGTRSPDGSLRSFFRGAFWVACRAGVPLVPLVVHGTGEILPKRKLLIQPRPVRVCVLEPIHPESVQFDSFELRERAWQNMQQKLRELSER